jgi:nuclear transcription Y subunit beta
MMETTMDNTMLVTPTKKAKEDSAVAPASSMANTPASVATSNYSDAAIEGNDHGEDDEGSSDDLAREQDRLLPIANVARIMKQAVPGTAKVAKDAKECVQECVSEFISFVTSEYFYPLHPSLPFACACRACERCQQEKRKTINGEDIIYAMEALGFEQYAHIMKLYLQKYKEVYSMLTWSTMHIQWRIIGDEA